MATHADLVAALRLPAGTFAASSGTDVVVDLLVLRRRLPGDEPAGPAWARTITANLDQPTAAGAEPLDGHPPEAWRHPL